MQRMKMMISYHALLDNVSIIEHLTKAILKAHKKLDQIDEKRKSYPML